MIEENWKNKICELKWYLLFLHLEFCSQVSIFCALSFFNLQTNLVTNNFVIHCQKKFVYVRWKRNKSCRCSIWNCRLEITKKDFLQIFFRRFRVRRCTRIYNLIKDRCCCLKFTFPRPFCKIKIHVSLLFEEVLSTLFYV